MLCQHYLMCLQRQYRFDRPVYVSHPGQVHHQSKKEIDQLYTSLLNLQLQKPKGFEHRINTLCWLCSSSFDQKGGPSNLTVGEAEINSASASMVPEATPFLSPPPSPVLALKFAAFNSNAVTTIHRDGRSAAR